APAAVPATAPSQPAASATAAWELEWEDTVAAAKKEGKLALVTLSGAGYRKGVEAFEKTFPGVTVEHTGLASFSAFVPKVAEERKAGIYNWDATDAPALTGLGSLKPAGTFDPVRPLLIRPDIKEDKNWRGGFEYGWLDKEKQFAYGFAIRDGHLFWINTDQVSAAELKSGRDLLNPKWKGKIIMAEAYTSGFTYTAAVPLRKHYGDAFLKQLFVDQEPIYSQDPRRIMEEMVRGKFAIATGVNYAGLQEFTAQGLGKTIELVKIPEARFVSESPVWLFNKAPHPNAAKLFVNWLLTKDGQTAWTENIQQNSRRTDVTPFDPSAILGSGQENSAVRVHIEETQPYVQETRDLLKKLLT
ncbi:MAG: extracellular solute-binding protein, partial [Chloroflexota bacterium]